jgi:cellulose synthase/poly-beta-1,6-N-acetylglucosamine synthase-like glycosyltransferase
MKDLAIIIPCRNEDKNILNILNKLKKNNIFLINDASTDHIEKKLKTFLNVTLINNKKKLGYEKSILKGIKFLTKLKRSNIKYILTMDADGEHNPLYVKTIYNKIKSSNFDMVIGNRSKKNRNSEEIISKLFKKKFKFEDPFSGFKIYKKKQLFDTIKDCTTKYFLADLTLLFLNKKFKITNIKINTEKNIHRNPRVNRITVNNKILSIKKII